MRRIDGMHLHREVRRPGEHAVRFQRGDHIVWRAEMNIHRGDHAVQRSISGRAAQPGQARAMPPQPDVGETQRFVVVVGDEHGARREDARLAARGQRLHVGVDHRVLDLGQRQIGCAGGPGLRARQHETVARCAGPPGSVDRERRLPDAPDQARIHRIHLILSAGERPPRPGVAQHLQVLDEQASCARRCSNRTSRTRKDCRRLPRRLRGGRRTSGRAPRSPRRRGSAAPAAGSRSRSRGGSAMSGPRPGRGRRTAPEGRPRLRGNGAGRSRPNRIRAARRGRSARSPAGTARRGRLDRAGA